ncbi:MAG: SDR family NAD(P)-dependent oxidoreductase [Balneolaceae bacterium]|jgi:NAD(P)-dependent dehydrogenase (short-subunit alcohol dehydrogenase family)
MKIFKDRIAVVTGAASGIGRGMVETFIEAGMKVVLADLDKVKLENTFKTFQNSGAEVLCVHTDVSKPDQVEKLAKKTIDAFGAVHVLCNNAGVGFGGRHSWEIPFECWRWVLGVNLMGVIYGIHYFMPIMLKQEEAHIVNTSSIAGLLSNVVNIPYGVSKHGVVALTESLHHELQILGANVKVSVLCPGPVNTDIMDSSERNRPPDIPAPPELSEQEAVFRDAYKSWIGHGLDPKVVGRQVLEAIKEEHLYVITTNEFDGNIEQRMKGIIERKNLAPPQPPKDLMAILQEISSKS